MVISAMTRLTPAALIGSHSTSSPTATHVLQHALEGRGDRELADRLGQLRRRGCSRPSAPTEKSPLTPG